MKIARPAFKAAALAAVGVTVLAACSSSSNKTGGVSASSQYPGGLGAIPAAATGAKHAGTITWAMTPGAVPNWIFPINTSSTNSVFNAFTFQDEMWRPLFWTVNGVTPEVVPSMSLAKAPVWSNGDKTVTFTMSGYKWSDGTPVTANDLLFAIDLIKAGLKESPSNWSGYVPGYFPDDMTSATVQGSNTLVLNLKAAVNPSWFIEDILSSVTPMPAQTWAKASASGPTLDFTNPANAKKIFDFLTAQAKSPTTYASNPLWQVVDGPYKLTAFNATTGAFTMAPNSSYSGPHVTPTSSFQGVPFTSDTAEFNAVKAGSLDIGYVPQTDVPQLGSVKASGYNTFGEPDFGMTFAAYNFKDATGHFGSIVSQLYFRQAMAHLEDQAGYVKAFFGGAGGEAYGPIPAAPVSPYLPSNAATDPYPFSVSAATQLLSSHGWKINAGGTDTCVKAGTAANECGAGIPAGTPLSFNVIYSTAPAIIGEQITDLASKGSQAGIHMVLTTSNFNYLISNYIDPADPANINKWAMMDFGGETDSTYPTTFGLFNTGGSGQIGDYSNPTADSLIRASIAGGDPAAVKAEAQFLTTQQPVLFQPNPDYIWAWKKTISGMPSSFASLTQYYANPEYWYFTK